MKSVAGVLISVLCVWTLSSFAGDWPRFLGPNGDGFAPDKGINKNWGQKPPKVLWKTAMTDGGYSGPSAAAGKVYIVDHKGTKDIVRAIDMQKGTPVWETPIEVGKEPAYCTPLHDGGKLYVVSRQGLVNCVTADKGEKVWSANLAAAYAAVAPQWKHSWSVVSDGAAVLLTAGGAEATIVALDKSSGQLLWKGGGTDGAGYAPVVPATIAGRKCHIVSAQTTIRAVDSKGTTLWSFPWENQWKVNAPAPIVSDDKVFITSGYGKGCALLDGKTGHSVWQNTSIVSHMSTPILVNGFIYSTSDPGKLVCMEFKSGKVQWEQPGFEKGGLCAVDGTMVILDGKNGDVTQVAISPDAYKELGRMQAPLGGQSWTAPIVADGHLVIRNKQQLACIDLK